QAVTAKLLQLSQVEGPARRSLGSFPKIDFVSLPLHNPHSMFTARLAMWLLTLLEAVLVVAGRALAWMGRRRHSPALPARLYSAFAAFARRKTLSVVCVGLLSLTARLALLSLLGIPEARWNDEFSYLLAGKTFASGRITNPTPPLWVHLETFHVI